MERTKANKKTLVVRHESRGPGLQVTKWWPVWWITDLGRWSLRDFHLLLVCFETNYCLLHIWCLHLEFRTFGSHRSLLVLIPGGCVCADKNEADVASVLSPVIQIASTSRASWCWTAVGSPVQGRKLKSLPFVLMCQSWIFLTTNSKTGMR